MADGNLPTYVTESTTVAWAGGSRGSGAKRLAGSFVSFANDYHFEGSGFLGVQSHDLPANAPLGTPVGVDIEGIVQVYAGAPISLGAAMTCQAFSGEFITAAVGNDIAGRAMTEATAAGQRMLMKITREGKA